MFPRFLGLIASVVFPRFFGLIVSEDATQLMQLSIQTNGEMDGISIGEMAGFSIDDMYSRSMDDPVKRERKMCPHEIEEQKRKDGSPFGCRGKLYANGTKACSWWGEPHVSATWPSQLGAPVGVNAGFDIFFKPGLFRMAKAKDNSWELQTFNCGLYASAFAARFGKDIVEIISNEGGVKIYLNGKLQTTDFPLETETGTFLDNSHRESRNNYNKLGATSGACVDDGNSGQIYFEVNANSAQNLNVHIRAAQDSWDAEDGNSLCNKEISAESNKWRVMNWDLEDLTEEESLFTVGAEACRMCDTGGKQGWWAQFHGSGTCVEKTPHLSKDFKMMTIQQSCNSNGLSVASAKAACGHLQNNLEYYKDCQLDWCTSAGNDDAAAEAEGELDWEHPVPRCVKGGCDAAKVCCEALKNKNTLNLGNVAQNNLCSDAPGATELRYTDVFTSNGVQVDLVIKPTGEFKCTNGATNAKNGVDGKLGVITLPVGQEVEFSFTFVNSGTDDLADVDSVPFSFLDLDQGKKGKQRESVEVCGAKNAVVTSNSELGKLVSGDCIKMTSATYGRKSDNPDDPADMSTIQRARTVAYQTSGPSFTATLGVTQNGEGSRKFMFAGHPTVACAEQNDMMG